VLFNSVDDTPAALMEVFTAKKEEFLEMMTEAEYD